MTKTKALELMKEYDRNLIDPALARKIAKVFGYSLSDLGIKPKKVKTHNRVDYTEETAELSSVSMYRLAQEIAENKSKTFLHSMMNGIGSHASEITRQAIEILK